MFKAGSGGGGTLQRLSDFQLAEMSSAPIESGGGPQTITEGDTIDASVRVRVADGAAAAGATIRFYAQDGDLLECSDNTTAASCTELTGADGLASVGWIPVAGSRSLYALGCGIAVGGESTPQTPTDGILGVLQSSNGGICDRDPAVVDGYDSSVDGYANGAIAATVDPFEPYNDTEIALNDLPLVFTANVEKFCDNVGETTVTCEFTDQNGGTLTIDDGTTGVQLNIRAGNGYRVYTLAFAEDAVDVDVRTFGAAVSVTADPPLEADLLALTRSVLQGVRHIRYERRLRDPAGCGRAVGSAAARGRVSAGGPGSRGPRPHWRRTVFSRLLVCSAAARGDRRLREGKRRRWHLAATE